MTEKVKAIKERIQAKETRSLWQKNIKDYAVRVNVKVGGVHLLDRQTHCLFQAVKLIFREIMRGNKE